MDYLKPSFTFLSVTFLSLNLNAAELSVPKTVDVLAINGKRVADARLFNLVHGDNQLVIRYSQSLKDGSIKKQYQSKPYVVSVPVMNESSSYSIEHKHFRSFSAAQSAFKNDKAGWLLKMDNGSSLLQTTELPGNDGFLPYQDIEKAVATYNTNLALNADDSLVVAPEQVIEPEVTHSNVEFVNEVKAWYTRASPEERKAILKWMIEQQ